MEGERRGQWRPLKRSFERSRLQEELWERAYEHIWPLVRRKLIREREGSKEPSNLSSPFPRRVGA